MSPESVLIPIASITRQLFVDVVTVREAVVLFPVAVFSPSVGVVWSTPVKEIVVPIGYAVPPERLTSTVFDPVSGAVSRLKFDVVKLIYADEPTVPETPLYEKDETDVLS